MYRPTLFPSSLALARAPILVAINAMMPSVKARATRFTTEPVNAVHGFSLYISMLPIRLAIMTICMLFEIASLSSSTPLFSFLSLVAMMDYAAPLPRLRSKTYKPSLMK